jgi:phosphoadenosine phosphosulfate reductase
MSLIERTLFGTVDKIARSIERIKHYEPPEGYYLAFSGGKDSIVIHKLAEMADVKFTAHYNYSGLDQMTAAFVENNK